MNRIGRAAAALGFRVSEAGRKRLILILVLFAAGTVLPAAPAYAATLSQASVTLSDSRPSATGVTYTLTGSSFTSTAIECIQVVFSTTASGQINPSGWSGATGSITTASSSLFSSWSGWSLATSDGSGATLGSKNVWQYTNSSGATPTTLTGATFAMANVANSSIADTGYYLQFSTYDNTNCSSSPVDNATTQFINTDGSQLSLNVDDSLSFSVAGVSASTSCDGSTTTATSTGTTLTFGVVSSASNAMMCQSVSAATNASNGYTVYIRYTGAPSDGFGHTIQDISGSNALPVAFPAPGNEAYGYTTSSSTLSTCGGSCSANRFTDGSTYHDYAAATTTNEEVAYSTTGVSSISTFVGHQVGISNTTAAGNYSTTIIYTCTPTY